jgi:hypothetical protein
MHKTIDETQLTDARGLLEQLWAERGRPSLSWLRQQQKRKAIPYIKVAGKVFFDPAAVRKALDTCGQVKRGE